MQDIKLDHSVFLFIWYTKVANEHTGPSKFMQDIVFLFFECIDPIYSLSIHLFPRKWTHILIHNFSMRLQKKFQTPHDYKWALLQNF